MTMNNARISLGKGEIEPEDGGMIVDRLPGAGVLSSRFIG